MSRTKPSGVKSRRVNPARYDNINSTLYRGAAGGGAVAPHVTHTLARPHVPRASRYKRHARADIFRARSRCRHRPPFSGAPAVQLSRDGTK